MKSVLTPLDFLARSAHVYPNCIAAVDGERRFTYAELNQRVHQCAASLQHFGTGPGDRVAVLARNNCLALEAHFAVPLIGGALVMLNTRLQPGELAHIIHHSGAQILLGDPDLLAPLVSVRAEMPGMQRIVADYEAFLAEATDPAKPHTVDEDDVIAINYTSGTTGNPKGVMYTHRGGYMNALGEVIEHGLTFRSVYLWTLPMFHCNGWCFPWAVTAVGARHVCLTEITGEKAVGLIQRERVTHLCGAPVVVRTITEYCLQNGIKFDHLKMVTAGAPPQPAVIRAAEQVGIEIAHVYGLTETYGPHTVCAWNAEWDEAPLERRAQLRARQGVPYVVAGTDVRVVDEEMHDVPADEQTMGEIVMRGNNVMLGYYRDQEATATAFRGGWFHSGDLAVMHPDGYLEIRDRAKDIIISGGENISSVEVERVLFEHPAVMEAALVARPHPRWGEIPVAYVGLKDGAVATEQELIDFCRARLAHFKCPKAVEFGPLPKTATGKIRKNILRQQTRAAAAEGA